MKKSLPIIFAVSGGLLVLAFLAWSFSLHGTAGLFHVNGIYRWMFLGFGLAALALLLGALLYGWLISKAKPGITALVLAAKKPGDKPVQSTAER